MMIVKGVGEEMASLAAEHFFEAHESCAFQIKAFFCKSQDVKNNENGNDGDSDYETFTFALWFSPSAVQMIIVDIE